MPKGKLPPEIVAEINTLKEDLQLSDHDTLNWKAFLAATVDKNLVMREDKIRFAFDHFQHHEDKEYLTLEDFADIFCGEVSKGKEIFAYLDTDGDGKVSFDDFRKAMEECINIDDAAPYWA
jgi:Ca2+-binding EF-hand superfamily protein